MSDVSIAAKMTPKQAGALYMKSLRQAERIKQLKDALRGIVRLAEADPSATSFAIVTKAKAAIEEPTA